MNTKQLETKVNNLFKAEVKKLIKSAEEHEKEAKLVKRRKPKKDEWFVDADTLLEWARKNREKAQNLRTADLFPVPFRKTRGEFVSKNLDYNPLTGLGHSYRWYEIAKRIGGVQYLNSYNYSSSTSKHVGKLRDIFGSLGIKYVEIEAPSGLQKLEVAVQYYVDKLESLILANEHARKPYKQGEKMYREKLAILAKLGFKATKKMHAEMRNSAMEERKTRLERMKAARKARKVAFILGHAGNAGAAGWHVTVDRTWEQSQLLETNPSRWTREKQIEIASEALSRGHNEVYVHAKGEEV